MKIDILQPIGYCEGVKRAIEMTKSIKESHPKNNVYVFNMLVHNQIVISKLTELNIITLVGTFEESLKVLKEGDIVIFSAHGHDPKYTDILKEKGIIVFDAVCPKVHRIMEIIQKELLSGHQVIYLGIKNHQEANAALSLGKDVLFFSIKDFDFDFELVKDKEPIIINQTTLNIASLSEIYKFIQSKIPNVRIQNEICPSTRLRQENIMNIKENVDCILIVGDKKSSNTLRLLEIAKTYHPTIESEIISDVTQINIETIKTKKHLVITSGASTPHFIIEEILDSLKNLK